MKLQLLRQKADAADTDQDVCEQAPAPDRQEEYPCLRVERLHSSGTVLRLVEQHQRQRCLQRLFQQQQDFDRWR